MFKNTFLVLFSLLLQVDFAISNNEYKKENKVR